MSNPPLNPPPFTPACEPKTSGLAITSLVLGVLALLLTIVCIGGLLAIPAIICGHIACSQIKRSEGALGGKGLAIAGFSTGYASLALLLLLSIIAIPNFVKARQIAQKNACVMNQRLIDSAKQQWASANSKPSDAEPTAQDLSPWLKNGTLPNCPADGTYTIGAANTLSTCSIPGHTLSLHIKEGVE